MNTVIHDNNQLSRYEMQVDGKLAFVAYTRTPGFITLAYTEVPKELTGRGIATALTREVLDMARANGDKVIPRCSFTAAYMRKHKKTQNLLAEPTYLDTLETR